MHIAGGYTNDSHKEVDLHQRSHIGRSRFALSCRRTRFAGILGGIEHGAGRGEGTWCPHAAPERAWSPRNLVLRQQLAVMRVGRRPRLRPIDRAFWIVVSRAWSRWVDVLAIVKPATVIGWHRRVEPAPNRRRAGEPRARRGQGLVCYMTPGGVCPYCWGYTSGKDSGWLTNCSCPESSAKIGTWN
jgi:hypothetical protein